MPSKVQSPTAHTSNPRPHRSNPVEISIIFLLRSLSLIHYTTIITTTTIKHTVITIHKLKSSGMFNRKERSKEECKGVGVVGEDESVVESSQANCHLLRHWHGLTHLGRHLHHCHHRRLQIHRVIIITIIIIVLKFTVCKQSMSGLFQSSAFR